MTLAESSEFLGQVVDVVMDRPMGSRHPRHGFEYPVNYGYIPGTLAPDGKGLDAYVLGVDTPIQTFRGECVAVIARIDDADDTLIVVPHGHEIDDDTIRTLTHFQEQWFQSRIVRKG